MITTYLVEYAKSNRSKCSACDKGIIDKSLRFGVLTRKDKSVKKAHANIQWIHFSCFAVPEALAYRPIELLRGHKDLKPKDKFRVATLIGLGTGKKWNNKLQSDQEEKGKSVLKVKGNTEEKESKSKHIIFEKDDEVISTAKKVTLAKINLGVKKNEVDLESKKTKPKKGFQTAKKEKKKECKDSLSKLSELSRVIKKTNTESNLLMAKLKLMKK